MQNMAENVFNRCQRDVCAGEKKKVTKNFLGQICTPVSGLNSGNNDRESDVEKWEKSSEHHSPNIESLDCPVSD